MEYLSSPKNDIIADQFCYLLENIIYDPLSPESLEEPSPGKHRQILSCIKEEYPQTILSEGVLVIKNNQAEILATANLWTQTVDCKDEYLKMRVLGLMANYLEESNREENLSILQEM